MTCNFTYVKRLPATASRTQSTLLTLIIAVLTVFAAPMLQARNLTVVYAFKGRPDGSAPSAPPVQDKQGNLYISTAAGGISDWGSVVKIEPNGKETLLHSFIGGKDGVTPTSGLLMDAAGDLYGTTYWGGNADCFNRNGCGVVYKLSPGKKGWTESILYAFTGGADGAYPGNGTLVSDAAGNLYGTTLYGGSAHWPNGNGTIFRLTHTSTGWEEHVLYAFGTNSRTDGSVPYAGLILDAADNIYGTTYFGGPFKCSCGIVFKIDPQGSETVLHNFKGGFSDGQDPLGGLVRDEAGNVYGATPLGGDTLCQYPVGCGIIFKIDTNGVESVLHIFDGYSADGAGPIAPLMRSDSGTLYGAGYLGGNSANCRDSNQQPMGCGVIFSLSPDGKETILYNFSGTDGVGPTGLMVSAESFYGTTAMGGPSNNGVVFKFTK